MWLAGLLACAGSAVREETPVSVERERIQDVLVESSGSTTRVTLLGPAQPVFTAFQKAEPERLMVELAGVDADLAGGTIPVYDGNVEEISVASALGQDGGPAAQVELSLVGAVDYDVRPGQGGLVIEVTRLSDMGEIGDAGTNGGLDPWSVTPEGGKDDEMGMAMADGEPEPSSMPMAMPVPTKPASVLKRVEAERMGGGAIIRLVSDGMLESASTFTLEDPARLVVDLPGVKSEVERDRIEVGAPQASRIRVGAHADKVRVVIDGGDAEKPFDGRQVLPVATGLVIGLGSDPALETAMQAASGSQLAVEDVADAEGASQALAAQDAAEAEAVLADAEDAVPAAAAPADSGPEIATIFGVEFEPQQENDRVLVMSDSPVDYLIYEPDPETVVLSLAGSILDRDAATRIAPEPGGPVSLVTAFDQPDLPQPEVRVVMKRAPHLKPMVTRKGSSLVLDFPHSGGQAETPPVLVLGESKEPVGQGGSEATAAMDGSGAGMQMAEAMPMGAPPASLAPAGSAAAPMPAAPGAMDPPAAISILSEGGLMDGKEYVGRRISLDFKEVDIADVLRLIAEVSDLNVIAGDEVSGKVTIRLVDVPWDQALDVILLTKGLGFVRIGNVLRIAAADVIAQEEELRLQERRAKEKLEDLVVKLQPVNYADVKDVSKMVNQLLTPRGTVNVDKRTNTLIIKDIASVIDEATALVKAVDTMTPQVMIEAKIVEASLDFSREFGAIWSFGTNPLTQSTLGGRDWVFNGDNNVAVGNSITSFPNALANIGATVLDSKFNIDAQLQAAEVNGDGKVISSPRIVTLDNSQAKIEQGVSIPFQTFENGDAQLEFVDAVLQLKTTPHITSDKSIIMEIEVSRNAPDDSVFTLTGSPAIAKNQVKTETLVKDGQTLVLGGIYVVDKSERQSRVPYLHKVPFLGNAFKSQEYSDSRKELLIFVTPRVVQTPGAAS